MKVVSSKKCKTALRFQHDFAKAHGWRSVGFSLRLALMRAAVHSALPRLFFGRTFSLPRYQMTLVPISQKMRTIPDYPIYHGDKAG